MNLVDNKDRIWEEIRKFIYSVLKLILFLLTDKIF